MRPTNFPVLAVVAVLALLLTPELDHGQPPNWGGNPKPPPDEFRSLLKQVEEAYKAPYEVDQDVLKELRKQYENPTPQREDKIFREIRRLYNTTPDQERAILRELRRSYDRSSAAQEERLFQVIRSNGRLPAGTVPAGVQADQAGKLFRQFDANGDGVLSRDEVPESLRGQWRRWDRNRDGVIDFTEYAAYFRAHLDWVSDKVASGEIAIKLPKSATAPAQPQPPPKPVKPQPVAVRYGKLPPGLPAWFEELDTDRDGQVGLYEWRKAGRPTAEFREMDLDGDGLLTPDEYLRYVKLRQAAEERPSESGPEPKSRWAEPPAKPGKTKPEPAAKPDKNKKGKPR